MAIDLSITAAQIEFLAEDEKVTIIPNFKLDSMSFIGGEYGPFIPLVPIEIPLWLAVTFKKRQKCKIKPPTWLSVDHLTNVLSAERKSATTKGIITFEKLPFHYMEIATQLLDNAPDDIPNSERIRTLIEDLWAQRNNKIRDGLAAGVQSQNRHFIGLNDVCALELNTLRPLLLETMNKMHALEVESNGVQSVKNPFAYTASGSSRATQGSTTSSGPRRTVRQFNQ
jgi:GINS complex subunit 2